MRPIIIEGVDGSGKSTLAKKICSTLDTHPEFIELRERYAYMHNGGPTTSRMHAHTRQITSLKRTLMAIQHGNIPVWDRIVAVSEWAYGSILRYRWRDSDLPVFYRWLEAYNPILIYCNTNLHRVEDNLKATEKEQAEKDYKSKEHFKAVKRNLDALNRAYDRYMDIAKKETEVSIIEVDPFILSDIDLENFLCAEYL